MSWNTLQKNFDDFSKDTTLPGNIWLGGTGCGRIFGLYYM